MLQVLLSEFTLDSGYYAACTALKTQTQALEIAANNIANVNTSGYSAAQLDKRRAGQLATAIQTAFLQSGSLPPNPADTGGSAASAVKPDAPVGAADAGQLTSVRTKIEAALSSEISSGNVAVHQTAEGLTISLREVGFFDTGSDEIKTSAAGAFARLAGVLRETNNEIRIEGHTDNMPIHNARFTSNWDLSTARATATVRLLIQQYRLKPEQLVASGYAEFRPAAGNDTREGRATNRRVDIVLPQKHE